MIFSEQREKGWEDYSIFIEMQSIFRAMFWILDFFLVGNQYSPGLVNYICFLAFPWIFIFQVLTWEKIF